MGNMGFQRAEEGRAWEGRKVFRRPRLDCRTAEGGGHWEAREAGLQPGWRVTRMLIGGTEGRVEGWAFEAEGPGE